MDEFDALLEDPATSIAVVGAGNDPAKWGGRIYRNLKGKGFRVLAVNPGRAVVDGDPCYPSVADLPEVPTIVNIVVPPPATRRVLQQCLDRGPRRVWVQPGAEDDAVLAFLAAHGFTYRAGEGDCIMVSARPPAATR
jgi:predicted CoA-binding protein